MFFMAFSGSSAGLSFAFCLEIAGPILCSLAVLQPKTVFPVQVFSLPYHRFHILFMWNQSFWGRGPNFTKKLLCSRPHVVCCFASFK